MSTVLSGLRPPFVLLEDRLAPMRPSLLYVAPVAVVRCDKAEDLDGALERIEAGLAEGLHAAGLLSYELGYALEPRLAPLSPPDRTTPLLWFGLFNAPQAIPQAALDSAFAELGPPSPLLRLRPDRSRDRHVQMVETILDLIAAGDLYQANLTFPMLFDYDGDPLRLYGALRVRQPVAHGGFAHLGEVSVVSVSPELWIKKSGDVVTARPMKGTAARGTSAPLDLAAAQALVADPKQRAENLMIVDLLRNDLSRISLPGTVRTPELFAVETYPSFHTLTSTVTARMRQTVSVRETLEALFPCGSIVGAPKIRAAEVIRSLETEPRGFYTGSLGQIAPNGDAAFNVAIRTAVITAQGEGRYGVGGGVVADSEPQTEYDEALLKAKVLSDLGTDFQLIETFRGSSGSGFSRIRLHLARLEATAHQLGFKIDRPTIDAKLTALRASWPKSQTDQRVRLLLARCGDVTLSHTPAEPPTTRPLRAGLSRSLIDAADPHLRYKTTRRDIYDDAFAAAAAEGLDEVLFLNRRGELTEASRNTLFVTLRGRTITPRLDCGVLPGVLRQSLILQGWAEEGVLTLKDLKDADGMFLGNSLYGLRPVHLASEENL